MRTAAICPTCATYTNAVCVIYDGPYLSTLDIAPLTNLDTIIQTIDEVIGALPTPTLQQVSDAGNTTTKVLYSQEGFILTHPITNLGIYDDGTFGCNSSITVYNNNILYYSSILGNYLSAARTHYLPNASGTFVLTVNGVSADNTGSITLPAATIPTLQQVTEEGLITDQPVQFEDSISLYDTVNLQWIELRGSADGFSAKVGSSAAEFLIAEEGNLAIGDGTGKVGNIGLTNLPALADKTYNLPNISTSSKTLVTSVNGVDAGTDGDVTISVSSSYTVYSALLSFNGSVVSDIVLENTLGVALNWTNPSNGVFRATAASGSPFTSNKTWISSGSYNNAGTVYIVASQPRNLTPTQAIDFSFFLHDGTLTGTPNVTNFSIEIRVYP